MAQVTRLGLHGGPRAPNGSFAGREENVVAEEAAEAAGGRKRRSGRRYPRWLQIDGKRYRVSSPEEERQLLAAMLDRAREAAQTGKSETQQKALRRVVRLARRIEKVDESEALWMQRLREMDEELISILEA